MKVKITLCESIRHVNQGTFDLLMLMNEHFADEGPWEDEDEALERLQEALSEGEFDQDNLEHVHTEGEDDGFELEVLDDEDDNEEDGDDIQEVA